MAGMGLGGFAAAGGGADALRDLLKQAFIEQTERRRAKQEDERIAIDRQRANDATELRKLDQEARAEDRASRMAGQAQTRATKLAGTLRPKALVTPDQSATLTEGGLGDKLVGPTLGSRNIGPGMTSTPNPGRGESFAGLPDQLEEQSQDEALERLKTLQPQMRGRLSMLDTLPRGDRKGVISSIMTQEAKVPQKSAALQEYEDARSQGYAGSFQQYQTEDANRKRPSVNVTAQTGQANNLAMKLADDYTRDAKDFSSQNSAMRRIAASANNPSAAGDMSLLYGYMKMLDPNSVVRESEFATAAQSGSLPQQIQGAATKILNGQRLTPEQRADFVDRAAKLYAEAKSSNATVRESYTQRAKKFGVDPSLVFTDIGEPEPATAGAKPSAADLIKKYGG